MLCKTRILFRKNFLFSTFQDFTLKKNNELVDKWRCFTTSITQTQQSKDKTPIYSFPNKINEQLDEFIKSNPNLDSLKAFIQQPLSLPFFKDKAFEATFMKRCSQLANFKVGQLFLQYLNESGKKPNIATLSRYLELCYFCPKEANVEEVEQLCKQIMNQFQDLDLQTTESLVLGLALTKSWKDGLKLIKNVETLGTPTVLSFSALAKAAIINNEFDVALKVMNQVIDLQKYLHDFVYAEWIEKSDLEKLFTLLDFWGTSEVFPQILVIDKLKQKFSEFQYSVQETSVNTKGCCTVCNKQLKSAALSVDQYKHLQQKFFDKVLTGSDVFIGSSPEEIERFQTLVKQAAPFDIVIDGLNVAYKNNYKDGRSKVDAVRHVVNYFASKGKKTLVLGKIHLRKWSAPLMKDIETKATVFLTDNLSRDDPFMLYAALYSGPGARVLSHDLMRDHAFRLGDPSSAALFRQWRRSCQLDLVSVSKSGRVVLQYPLRHLTAAQCNDGTWHVPYEDGSQRLAQQLPDTWLCIEKMNK